MAGNDFYNENGFTFCSPVNMEHKQAGDFMREVNKNPTHPNKRIVVKDIKSNSTICYTK